jgi:aminoglycoside 3-N-acetyltransferase
MFLYLYLIEYKKHMNFTKSITKKNILTGLTSIGVKNGDILLVHSALSKIGYVDGGADAVIDALLEAVGEEGTVLVPTLTGSADLSASNPPVFDVAKTPCWTGIIPETFRRRPEAIRSLHPTHSVSAIGKKAREITKNHENCLTPCGRGSPYDKLAEWGGYVLLVGVKLDCCTLLHSAEELAGLPYHMQASPVDARLIDKDGKTRTVQLGIHRYGSPRDFCKLEPILLEQKAMTIGNIGQAKVRRIDAGRLMAIVMAILAKDPEYLLAKQADSSLE